MSAVTTQGSPEPSLYSVPSSHKNIPTPAHCLSDTDFSDSGKDLHNESHAVSVWIGRPVSAVGPSLKSLLCVLQVSLLVLSITLKLHYFSSSHNLLFLL